MKGVVKYGSLICVLAFLFLSGCLPWYRDDRFIHIEPMVTNLAMINTEYDDFNAAGPPTYRGLQGLAYSSNSFSQGENFDILYAPLDLRISWVEGRGQTNVYSLSLEAGPAVPFLSAINSPYNELGPYLFHDTERRHWNANTEFLVDGYIYLMASDRPADDFGAFNIYYYTADEGLQLFAGNSAANDYYPSYHQGTQTLYFCSDRQGSFDIYSYGDEEVDTLQQLLSNGNIEPEPVWWSNGAVNDKTPFIYKDIMVFASDRLGNFDLHFSQWSAGEWSVPRALPTIIVQDTDDSFHHLNTEFNEYRPFLFDAYHSFRTDNNLLMVFSSDRPGGKGGYDLYLALLPVDIFR